MEGFSIRASVSKPQNSIVAEFKSAKLTALRSLEHVIEEHAKPSQFLPACYDFDTTPMPVQHLWPPVVTGDHRGLSEL